jgi:hypothetical protein
MECLYQALVSGFPEFKFKYFRDLGIIIAEFAVQYHAVMQYNAEIEKITAIKTIEIITAHTYYNSKFIINKVIEIAFKHDGRSSYGHAVTICINPTNYITNTHIMNIANNSFFTCNGQYYDWEGNLIKPIPHKYIMPDLNDGPYNFAVPENILQLTNHAILQSGHYIEGTWTAGETSKYGFNIQTLCNNGEEYIMIYAIKGTALTYLISEKECIVMPKVFKIEKDHVCITRTATTITKLFGNYELFYSNGDPYDQYDAYRLGDDYFTYYQNNYIPLVARKPDSGKHTKIAVRTLDA